MRYIRIVAALWVVTFGGARIAHADDVWSRYAEPFTPAWAAPMLEVSPEGGPPGTEVEIRGSKFHQSVQVFLGDQPMPIIAAGERFIVAVVPRYVRGDDFIYVVDLTGRARSFVPFDVIRSPRYRDPHPGPLYRR